MSETTERLKETAADAGTRLLGVVPHIVPLAAAVGPFGLDPRVRELVALAVARAHGCPSRWALHRAVGRLAGLTEAERFGDTRGLTAAERAAIALGLGTISRPDPELEAEPADQHYASEQIEQLRAVAIAEDLACGLLAAAGEAARAVGGRS